MPRWLLRLPSLAWLALALSAYGSDPTSAFFEKRLKADPDDFIAANQYADRLLTAARRTGRIDELRRANEVAQLSLRALPAEQNAGGAAVSARVAMAMHRFTEARQFSERLREETPAKPLPYQLLGDAAMELGDLSAARAHFDRLAELVGSSAAVESRLARLAWLRGALDEAAKHWEAALTDARANAAEDPDTLAWCLVQRGEFAFRLGRWDEAEQWYVEARKLNPNGWAAADHLAELRAAQGKDAEAIELFTKAATDTDRPEIWQALGDYHLFSKRPAEAKAAHDKALAGYRASVDKGELLYVHHLAGFYTDSQENAEEAVKWARKDLAERQTAAAWDVLAWALYRANDLTSAKEAAQKALATGLVDPHVLYHAAMIEMSAGNVGEGQRLLRRCAEVNPHFNAFHAHR
jgi:tetratricopeptide (TPR) repeat protein